MTTTSPSPLTPMQTAWMSQILDGPIPAETRATCDDCTMCSHVTPGAESFNPETKCCTFSPELANFLVGQVLADEDPAGAVGRASVQARIAAGIAVTPLGLLPPAVDRVLYRFGSARGFGQARAMRCQHYVEEGGLCGIWRHRNGICATWFCKHVRGEAAWIFWERVKDLLSAIEDDLARWCLLELGIGQAALARLFPPSRERAAPQSFDLTLADIEHRSDPDRSRALWGTWAGRETEFFCECARLVDGIDVAKIVGRCGPDIRVRVELVRSTWQRLREPEPPARLRVGQLQVIRMDPGTCRVVTYSGFDPVEMPRTLFDVLHHFDGRPTAEAQRAIRDAGGPELTAGLVLKMADFGVLVADGGSGK
jgi:hypothetical protein